MKCEDCKFWYEWTFKTVEYLKKYPHNREKGDCRKNSPVVAGTSEKGFGCWPDTNRSDWCGEFEEKE